MYVSVSYYKPEIQGYDTRAYTYETELDLIPGDIVSAPTSKKPEGNKAMVVEVDVPQPTFPCKKITEMWVEAEEGAGDNGDARKRNYPLPVTGDTGAA